MFLIYFFLIIFFCFNFLIDTYEYTCKHQHPHTQAHIQTLVDPSYRIWRQLSPQFFYICICIIKKILP